MDNTQQEKDVPRQEQLPRWRGALQTTIRAPIEKAWDLSADFCGMKRWVNTVDICAKIQGEHQTAGCVRYLEGNTFPRPDGGKSWAKEKLLEFDGENHRMVYTMLDNNFGLSKYVCTYILQDVGDGRTHVDWSFEVDAMANRTEQQLKEYMIGVYKVSLERLEMLCNS